jgi:Flp pilus assembly pilin Flp
MNCNPRHRQKKKDERGTTTAEYAIGTLAACAFAAVLYKILTGGSVAAALGGIVHRALSLAG